MQYDTDRIYPDILMALQASVGAIQTPSRYTKRARLSIAEQVERAISEIKKLRAELDPRYTFDPNEIPF